MRSLTLFASLFLPLMVFAQKPGEPSPEPPPEKPPGPVTARLAAKKSMYVLDRQGMTQAKYEEAIKAGKINPPDIDLVLEFKNNTKSELRLRISGAAPRLTLTLKGKGKIVEMPGTRAREPITYVTIKPGDKYEMPLKRLAGYSKGSGTEERIFWTEPGEYTLEATYKAYVQGNIPPPKGPALKGGAIAGAAVVLGGVASTTLDVKTDPIKLAVNLK